MAAMIGAVGAQSQALKGCFGVRDTARSASNLLACR
jgi:hypothetical protein